MEKKLPMKESVINTYPNYGHIFGIVGAYTQDYLPWLYNYFVQLMVPDNIEEGFRADYAIPHLLKTIPWIEYGRIDRDVVIRKWLEMSTFIKEMVDAGYYVYSLFDVSKFNTYGRKEFSLHDPLVYGYDDEKEVFYFADNYRSGKYAAGQVTFQEVNAATLSLLNNDQVIDWFPGIFYIKYKECYDYGNCHFKNYYTHGFDKQLYIGLLNDYLKQRNSLKRWSLPCVLVENDNSVIWGAGIYSYIMKYFAFLSRQGGKKNIDLRGFYILSEQKKILKNGIEYLMAGKLSSDIILALDLCVKQTMVIINICIKYNITHNIELIKNLERKVIELKDVDTDTIQRIIVLLEKTD